MSNDQGDKTTRYYIKHLDRTKGAAGAYSAPNWYIYERLDASRGSNAVCLCYDESTARRIMGFLEDGSAGSPESADRNAEPTGAE